MGNAPYDAAIVEALTQRLGEHALLDIHIDWALAQQTARRQADAITVLPARTQRLIRIVEKGCHETPEPAQRCRPLCCNVIVEE